MVITRHAHPRDGGRLPARCCTGGRSRCIQVSDTPQSGRANGSANETRGNRRRRTETEVTITGPMPWSRSYTETPETPETPETRVVVLLASATQAGVCAGAFFSPPIVQLAVAVSTRSSWPHPTKPTGSTRPVPTPRGRTLLGLEPLAASLAEPFSSPPMTDPGGAGTFSQTILVGPEELRTVGPEQVRGIT
jgi:hypothetical protein